MFEHGFIPPGPKEYFAIKRRGEGLIFIQSLIGWLKPTNLEVKPL